MDIPRPDSFNETYLYEGQLHIPAGRIAKSALQQNPA